MFFLLVSATSRAHASTTLKSKLLAKASTIQIHGGTKKVVSPLKQSPRARVKPTLNKRRSMDDGMAMENASFSPPPNQ